MHLLLLHAVLQMSWQLRLVFNVELRMVPRHLHRYVLHALVARRSSLNKKNVDGHRGEQMGRMAFCPWRPPTLHAGPSTGAQPKCCTYTQMSARAPERARARIGSEVFRHPFSFDMISLRIASSAADMTPRETWRDYTSHQSRSSGPDTFFFLRHRV